MLYTQLPWILIFLLCGATSGLRNVHVSVPQAIKRGGTAILTCDFDLEGDMLYSVKWYKGNYEFFRFTPKDETPIKVFPMDGLKVDLSKSNMTRLTINNVEPSLTGKYNCEVSVESSFHTELVSGDMEVVEVPQHHPVITGVKTKYKLGDAVTANCSSGRSYPPANLTWFINGEMAGLQQVEHFQFPGEDRLQRSSSRVTFTVRTHHFLAHRIILRCSANIHSIYVDSSEKLIEEDRLGDPTRVDIVLPANFLDEMDDEGHKKRRYSLGTENSSCRNHQFLIFLPVLFKLIFR